MLYASEKITNNIRVTAVAQYIEKESNPSEERFFFAYRLNILNLRNEDVQLLNRQWFIINSEGIQRSIRGVGVVGKNPKLVSKESFEYIS